MRTRTRRLRPRRPMVSARRPAGAFVGPGGTRGQGASVREHRARVRASTAAFELVVRVLAAVGRWIWRSVC